MAKKERSNSSRSRKSAQNQGTRRGATASDILGGQTLQSRQASKNIDPKWSQIYHKLLTLREELLEQINGHAKDAHEETPSYSMHMADSGTDSIDRDYALSLLSSEHEALYEIDQAISRIEEGTYGICEMTGKPISKSRLEAIPWARYSVEAQMELEKTGNWPHPHLGSVNSVQPEQGGPTEQTGQTEESSESEESSPAESSSSQE